MPPFEGSSEPYLYVRPCLERASAASISPFTFSGCSEYFASAVDSMLAGGAPLPPGVADGLDGVERIASASFFFTSSLFSLMLVLGVFGDGVAGSSSSIDFFRLG